MPSFGGLRNVTARAAETFAPHVGRCVRTRVPLSLRARWLLRWIFWLARPLGTPLERLRAIFLGGYPQLLDAETTVCGNGRVDRFRAGFSTETMGKVLFDLHVAVTGDVQGKGVVLFRT